MRVVQMVCGDGFAGVERYVASLAPRLAERGVEVTVVGGHGPSMRAALAASGVRWLPGDSMPRAARSLGSLRADVVASHMTDADLVGVLAGLLRRTPVVSTLHFPAPRGSSPLARVVGRWLDRRVAAQIAVSDYVATFVGDATVVRSGVVGVPEVVGAQRRERVVLLAQRLEVEKDTDTALAAWAGSRARHRGWELWIAGRGAEEARLRALSGRLGLADSVRFLGFRHDIETLFDRASLLLATAPTEAFGLSVTEAMAHGLPVLATAAGAHLETAGGATGELLFDPGDHAAVADLLDELIDDPQRRDRLAVRQRAWQRAELDVDRQVDQVLEVYRRVLAA